MRRPFTAVAAVAVVAVGVAACSSSGQASPGHSSNAPSAIRSTPVEAVLLAAERGISDRTARLTMNMSGTGQMSSLEVSGGGVVDYTNQSARIDMTLAVLSEKLSVTEIVVGGDVYENVAGIAGLSGVLAPGKSWLEIPIGTSLGESSELDSMGNPSSFLVALTRKGLKVTSIGSSQVDGVAATEYDVKFPGNLASLGAGTASLPSSVQQTLRGLTMHVWVDGSGLLRRISMSMAVPEIGGMKFTMDMSDYGVPVNVSAPPSSEVESFRSIAGALGSLASGSGSSL